MKKNKVLAIFLTAAMGIAALTGCGNSSNNASTSAASDNSSASTAVKQNSGNPTTVSLYLYGSEGVGNKEILGKINERLQQLGVNANLEVKYISWSDISTKYPLLFASGEKFDMIYVSRNANPTFYTLASQNSLAPLDKYLADAPELKAAIPAAEWKQATVNEKIYAVPNLYTSFNTQGFISRDDLSSKYKIPAIDSISGIESYLAAVKAGEQYAPINGNASTGMSLYTLFVSMTGGWVPAPGITVDQPFLVATSATNYKDIISPVFTQQFEDWCVRMHDWAQKGYFNQDILSSHDDAKSNFNKGTSGAFITHQPDWTGNFGNFNKNMNNVTTSAWFPAVANNKVVQTPGIQDATAISASSPNVDLSVKVINKLMTDKDAYTLFQYGILGKQYGLQNGTAAKPSTYNDKTDNGGFAAWAFRNDQFNIPYQSEDPRRYTENAQWKSTAIQDPFVGFTFNSSNFTTQLAAIASINSNLGVQLLVGKAPGDVKAAVKSYRDQLTAAGINDIINAEKSQLANFTPAK